MAILMPLSGSVYTDALEGISEYVRTHGGWACHFSPHFPKWLPRELPQCDGVIGHLNHAAALRTIRRRRIPAVNLLSAERPMAGLPSAVNDEEATGGRAAEELIARGFRNLAFRTLPYEFARRRLEGFRAVAEASRLRVRVYEDPREPRRGRTLGAWLRSLPKPCGVVACNDDQGRVLIGVCRELHLAVPEDVSVIGVDNDVHLCELTHPTMSSVAINGHRMGYEGAAMLARIMAGAEPPREPVRIPPVEVVVRQSSDLYALDDARIVAALRYIRDAATTGATPTGAAEAAGLSRRMLELRFRRMIGRSPRQEILRVQLDRAKSLLAGTLIPVADVAHRAGFGSPARFSMIFRREVGATPGAFRARHRTASSSSTRWTTTTSTTPRRRSVSESSASTRKTSGWRTRGTPPRRELRPQAQRAADAEPSAGRS